MTVKFQSSTCVTRPLTRSQQLIWTGQRLQPDQPLYNMAMAFTLVGELDVERFRAAFQNVINASEAMRTTFEHHAGVARQRFHEQFLYDVALVDLSASSDVDQAAQEWLTTRSRRLFDLERCLFESTLLRLDRTRVIWYFNQHHLVTDASSTALIYQATASEYERLGGKAIEPVSFSSYGDYVDYEQDAQSSRALERARSYWQSRTDEPIESASFYAERPDRLSGVTRRTPCSLGKERLQRIKALAESDVCRALTDDLAQFQVFATALFAWLYRVNGTEVQAISMPVHNRALAAHKKTPGLFIELYPLIVSVAADDTFATLYRKVASAVQKVLINTGPGASSHAINRDVQVVLNYITAEFGPFGDLPMSSQWVHPDAGDPRHLVRVQVENFDGFDQLRVFFDLNEEAFPAAQRVRPGEHVCRLLDAFSRDPDAVIAEVELLNASEYRSLAAGVAHHDTAMEPIETVVDAFLAVAVKHPERVALSDEQRSFSYRELQALASAFAAQLSEAGVAPGDRVGVALPRSPEAVVAILGTLWHGASYVPVDTDYPAARQHYILDNAGVRAVVHKSGEARSDVPSLRVDLSRTAAQTPRVQARPDAPAYVIYTSGSTGQPKGVEVAHRSLAHYVSWARAYYQPDKPGTWPLFSSLAFDLTVTSLFVPLCSGGELVVYTDRGDANEIAIRRVIEDNRVDTIKLTPAHLSLLQAMDLSTSRVQRLIVGGEDFRSELARSVRNYFGGGVTLYNEYGPTEGTVACSVHAFNHITDRGASVPIGLSIPGARLYVLNESLKLQPPGAIGELYIGGVGVALGYVNNPSMTEARFIDSPFCEGERLYRTGDLARLQSGADGEPDVLLCLGRVDRQVKVNGLRVEPGEIEQALLALPSVSDAVVTLYTADASVEDEEDFCVRCGISNRHPQAQLDEDRVCQICHVYAAEAQRAQDYFGDADDLARIVDEIHADAGSRPEGAADCMMLLSGGKDSTYALCQIVDLGLKPLVFTLDNGFISQGAKDNIARVVEHLGLELISGSTPAMNAIFRDSLNRFSNVCNGCFKTIYTLSLKIAQERGIRHIFTGLSRGQIFETRVADLFRQGEFDIERIDRLIIDARKAYHRADDAVSQLMDVSHFDDDRIFSDIQYVDYYRYTDVSLDTMLTYLKERVPWVRPADTGRSTNCLINEAGIYVHQQERGFHNYSLPYSWDVRLGHKERDAAREELDDNINLDNVRRILNDIEYTPRSDTAERRRGVLVAYYVTREPVNVDVLQTELNRTLPEGLVPSHFVELDALPLTANGKVDRDALPAPTATRAHLDSQYEAPKGPVETLLVEAWQRVFGMDRIGVHDNFFELGGDSIVNIQIVASVARQGVLLSPQQVFDRPTVRELAAVAGSASELTSEQGPVTGDVPLTPIQKRFFAWQLPKPERYCQFVELRVSGGLDRLALQESLRKLCVHHDALRARFERRGDDVHQTFGVDTAVSPVLLSADALGVGAEAGAEPRLAAIQRRFNLSEGGLFKATEWTSSDGTLRLLLVAHHLVVDAVSWWVLLEDLHESYTALVKGQPVNLPAKTSSMRHWSRSYAAYADSEPVRAGQAMWQQALAFPLALPARVPEVQAPVATTYVARLETRLTRQLLSEVTGQWRVQPQDVLLTALAEVLAQQTGVSTLSIDVEAHGREAITANVDVLRTVGWFTSVYPVAIDAALSDKDTGLLRHVRDVLRRIELGGTGFGAWRYLGSGSDEHDAPPVPVVFNYLGLWRQPNEKDALFEFAQPLGADYGEGNRSPYALEVNAVVYEGQLHVTLSGDSGYFDEASITAMGQSLSRRLRALIEHCAVTTDQQLSPEDFPNAGLDQDDLDDLLEEYGDL